MSLICNRCGQKKIKSSKEGLICKSCKEDAELLHEQLETNQKRIKKLKEHKESAESELSNSTSKEDQQRLFETLKRIEHNLKVEYKIHEGVNNAIKNKDFF